MESQTQSSSSFRAPFDHNTPEKIIALDKALRGLRAEIEVKIHNFSAYEGENKEMYLNQFNLLITELDAAIQEVESLVRMASDQSAEEQQEFYESESMQQFYNLVMEQLNELGKLKQKM